MFTAEQVEAALRELVEECAKRVKNGLDCSGCKYEDNCDDILKEVLGIERIFDR